jgi:hypothetical protein
MQTWGLLIISFNCTSTISPRGIKSGFASINTTTTDGTASAKAITDNDHSGEGSSGSSSSGTVKLHIPMPVKEFAEWFQDKAMVDNGLETKRAQPQYLHDLQKYQRQ